VSVQALRVARRPRAFVRVRGPEARDFLQRMVSNDVLELGVGGSCEALLLTPKARLIAPLRVWRRGEDDFLLLTESELGEPVRRELARSRFATKAEIEREDHTSAVVLGTDVEGIPNADYGEPAVEVLDAEPPGEPLGEDELELLRIRARTPRWGRELDDRVLPAEAGLVERAVSFTKGCYPGQEPIARLHHRGHANRALRVLELDGHELPAYDAELRLGEKAVGRVTSAVRDPAGGVIALAYVRVEVPEAAELELAGGRTARFAG
jgi:folate-binding protein YgfZ